jgi:hypothetical protein
MTESEEKENKEEIKNINEVEDKKDIEEKNKNEDIKEKIMNSKNEFLAKMKIMMENISSNYDNLISNISQNKNEKSENIFQNIEELQNNIIEGNENLNLFLKQNKINSESKEEKDEKILKINCNSNINEIIRKLGKYNFEKIIIKELSSNSFNEIFKSYIDKAYKDVIIKKCNIENYEIKQVFKEINKLKIKRCKISFGNNFLNFKTINELYLENINLINGNLNIILQGIKSNLNNIKILSIKNNNISKLNLDLDENIIYNNLEFLNLSNNKISKIAENIFDILPIIKTIDLTNNNINFICRYKNILNISKEKNCIILLSKNPGIIKEKNREEYCNYLKEYIPEKLNKNNHIKYLNLEGLFINKTYNILSQINFNTMEITFLNSLNLSHNNLTDQNLIEIIKNNKDFFSRIKKLILCSNYITEECINSLINDENGEFQKIFADLKKLDISGNHIKFTDLNQLKNLTKTFPNLKTLLLKYTPFENDYNNYLKMKAMNKIEEGGNKELSESYLQFEEIFEKEKFLNEKKIKIKMMNTNDYMHFNLIRKYFPYLLYNIKLETKFIEQGN